MTLALTTIASSGFSAATLRSGFVDTTTNVFMMVDSGNIFRRYNMTTGAQLGSNLTVNSGSQACCMINAASAVVINTTGTNHQFIEISSGYIQTVNGGGSSNTVSNSGSNTQHQLIALNPTASTALYIGQTNSNIVKVNTAQQFTINSVVAAPNGNTFTSIIYKGNNRWLAGNQFGHVIEIDDLGNTYYDLLVNPSPYVAIRNSSGAAPAGPKVSSLAYGDNLLLVSTDAGLFLYDYTTKTLIGSSTTTSNIGPIFLSEMYNGVVICSRNNSGVSTFGKSLFEVQCNNNSLVINDRIFFNTAASNIMPCNDVHVNPVTGTGVMEFSSSSAANVAFVTVTPPTSTTRTINVNPGGVHQQFRLITIDDTLGVGNRAILFDTFAQSPYTYRVATGKQVIELVKVGYGTDATLGLGRYST